MAEGPVGRELMSFDFFDVGTLMMAPQPLIPGFAPLSISEFAPLNDAWLEPSGFDVVGFVNDLDARDPEVLSDFKFLLDSALQGASAPPPADDTTNDDAIIVIGRLPTSSGGGGSGSGEWGGDTTTIEEGGSVEPAPTVQSVAVHEQDCSSSSGAAVQISDHVEGTLPEGFQGPPSPLTTDSGRNWTEVEFGAYVVRNPDGSFGAYNNTIYSNDQPGWTALPGGVSNVEGFWHTHGPRGNDFQQLMDRFPSPTDWDRLAKVATMPSANPDPSVWITGPDGTVREFKLSERKLIDKDHSESTAEEMDKLLKGRERNKSCS